MRFVDIDDVLDLFGCSDEDIYGEHTIEDALYDGSLKTTEVVRCKDCCYHEGEELGMVYCPNILGGGWVLKDFFCKNGSRGERK